jgi:hypothetical protein
MVLITYQQRTIQIYAPIDTNILKTITWKLKLDEGTKYYIMMNGRNILQNEVFCTQMNRKNFNVSTKQPGGMDPERFLEKHKVRMSFYKDYPKEKLYEKILEERRCNRKMKLKHDTLRHIEGLNYQGDALLREGREDRLICTKLWLENFKYISAWNHGMEPNEVFDGFEKCRLPGGRIWIIQQDMAELDRREEVKYWNYNDCYLAKLKDNDLAMTLQILKLISNKVLLLPVPDPDLIGQFKEAKQLLDRRKRGEILSQDERYFAREVKLHYPKVFRREFREEWNDPKLDKLFFIDLRTLNILQKTLKDIWNPSENYAF